ncbi:MAG: hypothetical protein A2V70_01995 [Planctomycetes bacterium RBG_13_63_9]|nr:MAG: hypothetical protein A2V70_01995 [Planctomycetes bacterium RBG_13_63_9]
MEKDYVVVLQCHVVTERCSGYGCERSFHDRSGGFADYPGEKPYRVISITCGGCSGLATHRKLTDLLRRLRKGEEIGRDRVVVQLASCITKDNFHSPRCPHIELIKGLIARLRLDCLEDTLINEVSEKRRREGLA